MPRGKRPHWLVQALICGFAESGVPYIRAFNLGDSEIIFWGVHTLPPVNREYAETRNSQIKEITGELNISAAELIVAGDLNCSPWSPYFRRLCLDGGLLGSRLGHGKQASWPRRLWPMSIPIDHILHSPGLVTCSRRLGSANGSDHRPVIADIAILDSSVD